MNECGYLEGCYNDAGVNGRMVCWYCTEPICPEHSNRIQVWCFINRGGEAMRRRRVCDDCLKGEYRP